MPATQRTLFGEAPIQVAKPYSGSVIYETRGRAREYRELACNLYSGCSHGCTYCWSPNVLQMDRRMFGEPKARADIIAKLAKDARRYGEAGEKRQVLFCFTCDPYQPLDMELGLTRQAIETCHAQGLSVCTLTKGGDRALRDLDLFTPADAFATTLTMLAAKDSLEWEPGAALPAARINTLARFHEAGIPTWVSLEPVIDPAVTLEIIRETHGIVDNYKVGVLNYHPRSKLTDWRRFAQQVVALLEGLGCSYYLKEDLRRYL